MRILILTQFYAPEPVFKFPDLARSLRARGHEVQVITGFPCYPNGRTYDGYRQRLYVEDRIDGVLVTRVPQFPDHSRSAVRRTLYYFSFALSAATIGLLRARRADVVLVYQSAFPVGLAAWWISRIKRTPYVLDVVDLWPESVAAAGVTNRLAVLSIIRTLVRFIYRGARRINVITQGYWDNLTSLGVPEEKLSLIHCWPAMGRFDPVPYDAELAKAEQLHGRLNIVYAGAMGPVQDLRTVVEAAGLLHELPQVQFVMIGDGTEHNQLVGLAHQCGATNVRFLGRRGPDVVQKLYAMADALLVHLKRDPLAKISIPSKTFAYLASGRPILMAVAGEASRLVERHGCGIAVQPSSATALASAVRKLIKMPASQREQMARAARVAYQQHYRSDLQINKFESLIEEAVGRATAPRRNAA